MKDALDPELLQRAMAAVRSYRRLIDTACEVCGAPLHQVPAKRRYCSNACTLRASRQRRRPPRTPNSGESDPREVPAAPAALTVGARVELRGVLDEVLRGSHGTVE